MLAALVGSMATIVVGMLACAQWYLGFRQQLRQRDVELYRWGSLIISLMAELEALCSPIVQEAGGVDRVRAEALAVTFSALVDQRRLFFSNVKHYAAPTKSVHLRAFSGYRPAILDEVLKCHYLALFLARDGRQQGPRLRQHAWTARGRFVTALQAESGQSLKRTPDKKIGEEIDPNPLHWRVEFDREHADPAGATQLLGAVSLMATCL